MQLNVPNGVSRFRTYENIGGLTAFKRYTLKFKYRSDSVVYFDINGNTFAAATPNVGTAIYVERDFILNNPSMAMFQINSSSTGAWMEIGEVSVTDKRVGDLSLYANHAESINNPTRSANGKRGGAYTFGSGAYLKSTLTTVPTTGYTIAAWIKLSELNREQHIADFTNNQFYVGSNNRLGTTAWSNAVGTTTLTNNVWYFVTITRDQSKVSLYLNGNSEGTGTTGANPANPLIIGHYRSLVGNYSFSGQIDEVRVFNHALNSGEVQMLYNSNLAKNITNNWSFINNRTNINGSFSYSGWAQDILGYTGVSS